MLYLKLNQFFTMRQSISQSVYCSLLFQKKYAIFCLLFAISCFSTPIIAQVDEDDPYYELGQGAIAVFGGYVFNNYISDLTPMLIDKLYDRTRYAATEKPRSGLLFGVSFATRLPNSPIFFQPEVFYQKSGAFFHYKNDRNTTIDMAFDYRYFNLGLGFRYNPLLHLNNPLGGIHVGIGTQCGIVVKDRLEYASAPDDTDDPVIREDIQRILKAKANWAGFIGLGYDYHWDNGIGFSFDARYNLGLSDVIETKVANDNFFSEQKNQTKHYTITLGLSYPLNPD